MCGENQELFRNLLDIVLNQRIHSISMEINLKLIVKRHFFVFAFDLSQKQAQINF